MSVSTKPGHTQFTRIPSAAWASARLLVILMTAALLALYGRLARLPIALEHAQEMTAHESPRTTKLYDRTKERLTQDEVERIRL
jgi:hypothetical protein